MLKPKSLQDSDISDAPKQNKLKKELFGAISAEILPIEYQMEAIRLELKIPKREWDSYTCAEKGKIMAVQAIQNRIELISRVTEHIEKNRKNAIKTGKN